MRKLDTGSRLSSCGIAPFSLYTPDKEVTGESPKAPFSTFLVVLNRRLGMQVIALAERGALYDPGPCMYMEKIAVGPGVDPSAVSLDKTVKENLEAVSKALGKPLPYALPFPHSCHCPCEFYATATASASRKMQPAGEGSRTPLEHVAKVV